MNFIYFVMNEFVMNSIGMFGKFMIFCGSFMNYYCPIQSINCHGAHQLNFTFMNFIDLIMNYFSLVTNSHYFELV